MQDLNIKLYPLFKGEAKQRGSLYTSPLRGDVNLQLASFNPQFKSNSTFFLPLYPYGIPPLLGEMSFIFILRLLP